MLKAPERCIFYRTGKSLERGPWTVERGPWTVDIVKKHNSLIIIRFRNDHWNPTDNCLFTRLV